MGYFDTKVECAICGQEIGLKRYPIKNQESICSECHKKCTAVNKKLPVKYMPAEKLKEVASQYDNDRQSLRAFIATKRIDIFMQFDDNQKRWLINDGFNGAIKNPTIYNYSDIIDFELIENEESITKGGLGRAVAGGLLFGGVGAVVGGVTGGKKSKAICSSLRLRITVKDMNNPAVYVNFLTVATQKSSFVYKQRFNLAQQSVAMLQLICDQLEAEAAAEPATAVEAGQMPSATLSAAEEIKQFKELMDAGIITAEEFEAKKKQLLGL